jgi:RHS repeat-associated protein
MPARDLHVQRRLPIAPAVRPPARALLWMLLGVAFLVPPSRVAAAVDCGDIVTGLFLDRVILPDTVERCCNCLCDGPCDPPSCPDQVGCNEDPNNLRCYPTQFDGRLYSVAGTGPYTIRLTVTTTIPGNVQNPPGARGVVLLFSSADPGEVGQHTGFCSFSSYDKADVFLQISGLTCSNLANQPGFGVYSLSGYACGGSGCQQRTDFGDLVLSRSVAEKLLGCPIPPPWGCGEGAPNTCSVCKPGGAGPAGGPPGFGGPGGMGDGDRLGGGAFFWYQAGGAGAAGLPGSTAWNVALGRHWSHSYAERIVVDPDASHVWLITRWATFREFSDPDASGVYQTVVPSDEYRTLTDTGSGWELRELDGTVHHFDGAGLWTATVDKNGNATTAAYSGSELQTVTKPDGRQEAFAYHPDGKLASVTVKGVDGSVKGVWSLTWSGDDLERLERPDGSAFEFTYGDANHPGYVTLMELVGTGGGRRVERGWVYDAAGNVIDTWAGDLSATGPDAVDRWQYDFDDPLLPAVTTVTDPLGNASTYTVGRDPVSIKPRLVEVTGDCPGCGLGPDTQLSYGDAANPLRPTSQIDGEGNETRFTYDAHGQMASRSEAFATGLERTTQWEYDANFPAFATLVSQPSTAGGGTLRETVTSYTTSGDLDFRTISGVEDGAPFGYLTDYDHNTAGQVTLIDPPGHGTDDQTTFSYDATRGDLVLQSRTDPLVGTTTFDYDAFNRRVAVTDPNDLRVETCYDALDRVTSVVERSAGTPPLPVPCVDPIVPADLDTEYLYDEYGDLVRTILSEGNVIEYGHDAAGRLVSVERKPDAATHGERTFYTLDAAGDRILEEEQSWEGAAWATESATAYEHLNRCQVHKVVQAPGEAEEATTEYEYDCNGSLKQVWDAEHPRGSNPATSEYAHDELNRLTSVSQPFGGAAGGTSATSYDYDVQDHLTSVTDAEGNRTAYVYSDRDRMTSEASEFLATGPPCGAFPDCSQAGCGCSTYSYDEHGELLSTTDPRGVTATRTVDAADRVTGVDYADDSLDVTYTYGDQEPSPPPDSQGRLIAIARDGEQIDYGYDHFGRLTRDGALTSTYDENGNRLTMGYPFGVTATYAYDFADRPVSLSAAWGGGGPVALVSGATYLPAGPLSGLTLGNGLSESRAFDGRYAPERITVSSLLDWDYSTDAVGNPTAVTDLLDPAGTRSYSYQDVQYFLAGANGPWGSEGWSYDRIGNRLTASEPGEPGPAVSTYPTNPAGGNSPQLSGVSPTAGGALSFSYDAAGEQTSQTATSGEGSPRTFTFGYDDAGRLAALASDFNLRTTELVYDGRGLLRQSYLDYGDGGYERTEPTYSSDGRLYGFSYEEQRDRGGPGDDGMSHTVSVSRTTELLYFGGRPVAQLVRTLGVPDRLLYLSTDHLGTPILATDDLGAEAWQGGFRPFGQPFVFDPDETLFLRLPGQWTDPTFSAYAFRGELAYNVYRWYQSGTGRYTRPDPLGLMAGEENLYRYAKANPLRLFDTLGLVTSAKDCQCCDEETARNELLRSGSHLFLKQGRYRWSPATTARGESCFDSATRLHGDLERFVAPKCWITSVQLVKSNWVSDLVKAVCGVYFPVHYVVKYEPCNGKGDDWFFDGYTVLDSGPLPPSRQIDEP